MIARAEIEAELRDLQRLARVARDGELFGVAPDLCRELAPHGLDVRLEQVPHVMDRRLVRDVEIALQCFVDDARAGARVAVVQVDDRAVEREGLLNLAPVALVGRNLGGRAIGRRLVRGHNTLDPVTGTGLQPGPDIYASSDRQNLSQKVASS